MSALPRLLVFSHAADLYGAPRSLLLFLEGLEPTRARVELVCPCAGPLVRLAREAGVEARVEPGLLVRGGRRGRARAAAAAWREVRRARPDLVYVNTVARAGPVVAAALCGVPSVVHVREGRAYFEPRGAPGRARLAALLALPRRFICVSRAVRALLVERGVSGERSVVVHNGVDSAAYAPDDPQARSSGRRLLGVAPDVPLVGMLGQPIPRKGGPLFLKAAARVAAVREDAVFVLVGGAADDPGSGRLAAAAARAGLGGRVRVVPFVDDPVPVYAALDVVANCSTGEPFARVNLEAMAAGRPVVATDVDGNAEAVADGSTGFVVPPGDATAMARRWLELLDDAGLRREMGRAGRRRVEREFTVERYRAGVAAAIGEILDASLLRPRDRMARSAGSDVDVRPEPGP